jgi:hypothetical protein
MTLGKLITLYREDKKEHGVIDKKASIDDAIPF